MTLTVDVESMEANLHDILGKSALDESEREALAGVLLEAANSGSPPIDCLGRYAFALDAIRWLLYVGKITLNQFGRLMDMAGNLIGLDGCLIAMGSENDEENKEATET